MNNINICTKCKKIFKSKYHLQKHLDKIILCGAKIICNICQKYFETNQSLIRHLNRKNPCKSKIIEVEPDKQLIILDKKIELAEKRLEIEKEKTNRKTCSKSIINNNINNIIYK
jgi:uncharacterized C2H2 Zn-finger protein